MGGFFFEFEALRTTESLRAGAGLVLEKLLKAEIILAAFPLHDRSELQACQAKWLVYWSWPYASRRPPFIIARGDDPGETPRDHATPPQVGPAVREDQGLLRR